MVTDGTVARCNYGDGGTKGGKGDGDVQKGGELTLIACVCSTPTGVDGVDGKRARRAAAVVEETDEESGRHARFSVLRADSFGKDD